MCVREDGWEDAVEETIGDPDLFDQPLICTLNQPLQDFAKYTRFYEVLIYCYTNGI